MRGRLYAVLLVFVVLPAFGEARGAGPAFLVKDINAQPDTETDSNPSEFLTIDGVTYFAADDGVHGSELWRTDGTAAGTWMLGDLYPGGVGSRPAYLVAFDGHLFFTAGSDFRACALWRSDGTARGTRVVRSFDGGAWGCISYGGGRIGPHHLTAVGRMLLFAATDDRGQELWRSDGTEAGTVRLKDINPSDDSDPVPLVVHDSILLFAADDGVHGRELWKSDGTERGTVLVRDINPGVSGAFDSWGWPWALAIGDLVIFPANDGRIGTELWRTDGTEIGTTLVADLDPGPSGSLDFIYEAGESGQRPHAALAADTAFFLTSDASDSFTLWRTDGTSEGTVRVRSFPRELTSGRWPGQLQAASGKLFFLGDFGTKLWVSDGTDEGTESILEFDPAASTSLASLADVDGSLFFLAIADGTYEVWRSDGTAAGTSRIRRLTDSDRLQGGLSPEVRSTAAPWLFAAADPIHGRELFRSDGTEVGTALVRDINPAMERTQSAFDDFGPAPWLGAVGDVVIFAASDGTGSDAGLWRSDGTTAGTFQIGRYRWVSGGSLQTGSRLFFWANDGEHGIELWRTDGTAPGTVLVKDMALGAWSAGPGRLAAFNGKVAATATVPLTGAQQLWVTDGSEDGTSLIQSFGPRSGGSPYAFVGPGELTAGPGDLLSFVAWTYPAGAELWVSDGTPAGTRMVKDINPDPLGLRPWDLRVWGGQLIFFADDGEHGLELWRSDGSAEGTTLLADLIPGNAGALIAPAHTFPGGLLVFGQDAEGFALFRSDGTPSGSEIVTRVPELSVSYVPDTSPLMTEAVVVNGTLFFPAYEEATGFEPWRSDGTAQGTHLVRDIWPGPASSVTRLSSYDTVPVGESLIFAANDGSGSELWRTDGSESGTVMLRDIDTRPLEQRESDYLGVTDVMGTVLFRPFDAAVGEELWKSDGTPQGTRLVQDIAPGRLSSGAGYLGYRVAGSTILFTADDEQHGLELWALPVEALALPCSGDCDDDAVVTINELVRAVAIVLGRASLTACDAIDQNLDARVTINELVAAVGRALNGR